MKLLKIRNKNRLQYISESLQKVIQQDKRKRKYSEEDVRKSIERLMGNFPLNLMSLKLRKNR